MTSGRVAVVTGGMGGLGEAIAIRLMGDGFRVVVTHSLHNDHVASWLRSQSEQQREFVAYPVDVADYDSCQECAARIVADIGPVDVLINNAGITRDATLRKMTRDDWRSVMSTDLDSVFNMSKPFCEGMVERRWGRIVNISSINGSKGAFGQTNYAAAKAGIHGFTKSLALELASKGVTVNTVSPGYLDTKMVRAVPQDVLEQRVIPQIPVGRLGRPAEVAALVAYPCSDDGAYVTGANIAINGGQHMD
ncbi:MAG: acetoacetyl-CoA reductase [Dyella sp.]|nr:acetoacetyl-CoA reductase [Dyella sp.]MBV8271274.1 acetoacetyl-CoA reductase [Cupriavidus sp.]